MLTLVYHTAQRGAFQSYQKHLMEGPTGGPATNYDISYTGAGDAPANPSAALTARDDAFFQREWS